MVRGKFVSSTMQTSANKISRLWGAIIIFVFFFNKSLSNLEILLILRSFFQWCRRGFSLTCSCQKLKKHVERFISFILTHHSKWKKRLSTINLSSPTNFKVGQSDFWDFPGSAHIFPTLPEFNRLFVRVAPLVHLSLSSLRIPFKTHVIFWDTPAFSLSVRRLFKHF